MQRNKNIEYAALAVTRAIGSPFSIFLHTLAFLASFAAAFIGLIEFDRMLLVLTTIVSLEAIYLAIFIQMTINHQAAAIAEVEHDIDEIQEDVGEIQADVEEISEDVEDIGEDVEEIADEEDTNETAEKARKQEQRETLTAIQKTLARLSEDVERLKTKE